MESLNVGVDAWIIQDGNYGDFTIGQKIRFALEFHPLSLKPSEQESAAAINTRASLYQVSGQVVYNANNVWVLDMGFLAYQESPPLEYATKGFWVEGEIYLGIDPFMYFEDLKKLLGMPSLTYSFRIGQIFLETTPWITKTDESGHTMMVRDEMNVSYREVIATDAWKDDNGNAHYVLECFLIEDRI